MRTTFKQQIELEKLINDPNFDKPLSEVFAPKHQPFMGKFWINLSLN
jgi:hypothetical protein